MRIFLKIITVAILLFFILFSAAYVFVAFKGKSLIINHLESVTHKKVSIGYFNLTLPFNLEIQNLNVEGVAKVDKVFISPSFLHLLIGNIALNNTTIIRPQAFFSRNPPAVTESSTTATTATAAPPVKTTVSPDIRKILNINFQLILKRFTVQDGRVDFIDNTAAAGPIKITVKDINIIITNLCTFPTTAIANFSLKGNIPWQEGQTEGRIALEGWMNFAKRDMQATLKVQDIDGIYLYPYYSKWVDLEKARIEKAKLNFASNIQSLNNDLTANCHLELTDIVRKPRTAEESKEKAEKIADAVLDILRAMNQGKIMLDFNIRTKMNNPQFGFGDITSAFEEKVAKVRSSSSSGLKPEYVLLLPEKVVEGGIRGATDITKAVIEGTFAVGNEFIKALRDSFRREPKEAQ